MSLYSIYTKMPESIRKFFRKSHLADCWRARIQRKCHKNAVKKVNWNVPVFYDEGILCRYINREKYHSQFGQDFFLDRIVFNGKKSGFFIDIGANHPEQLSNTLYFEDLGWHGMAFEPQAGLCALWKDRKTERQSAIILPWGTGKANWNLPNMREMTVLEFWQGLQVFWGRQPEKNTW